MALASFLLKKAGKVDAELDSLFKSAPTPITAPANPPAGSSNDAKKKRKLDAENNTSSKRAKSSPVKESKGKGKAADQVSEKVDKSPTKKVDAKGEEEKEKRKKDKKSKEREEKKKSKGKSKLVVESEDEEENSDLENAYLKTQEKDTKDTEKEKDAAADSSDDEVDPSTLVHESISGKGKKGSKPKVKFIPEDETPEQKDRRTIFVGNLPLEVAQKRPLLKQLQKHILALVPTAKIESTRFRSVPFQTPTSKLPTSDDEDGAKKKSTPRQHDLERTSAWRSAPKDKDEEEVKKDDKKFLSTNQKKKIAFISHEFHTSADSVNAYIVFAHPVPLEMQNRAPNVPPPKPTMDPYEAALEAVQKGDGTLFMERLIRVDLVAKSTSAAWKEEKKPAGIEADPKLSIFVGNLDFASKEDDLRVFFEGVVSAELGPPPEKEVVDDEGVKKPSTWVTRVRIVRDRDTQLGKGFAYVQFADRECVDEILNLEETKLKFAKRKLRVERCKTLPGASTKTSLSSAPKPSTSSTKEPKPRPARVEIPKGDPALGEKLASLSKDERKKVKSADADRVARRLAKKKARMAMGAPKVEGDRKRERERGKGKVDKGKRNTGKKEGGRRVRSEKSAMKRNGKK